MEKVWLKQYEEGVSYTIDPDRYLSLIEMIEESFNKYSEKPCYSNHGEQWSYQEIAQWSQAFAGWLQSRGCKKGDRIAIMLPNILQYPIVMLGALRAGLIVVNINPLYTPRETKRVLQDSGSVVLVVLDNFAHTIENILTETQVKHVVVTKVGDLFSPMTGCLFNFFLKYIKKNIPSWNIRQYTPFKKTLLEKYKASFRREDIISSDLAYLQYTGGTTGGIKGAMLTHRNMVANVLQLSEWIERKICEEVKIKNIVTALPLYHIFSLTGNCLLFLRNGYNNILITNPRDITGFVKELKRQPFSIMTGVNTLFNALLHNKEFCKLDFSEFKFALGGGMAVQRAVAEKWQAVTGVVLLEAYGLTEASPGVSFNPTKIRSFSGNIGLPLPSTEVKLCHDDQEIVMPGEKGELWVRGPQIMKGYWNQPEQTRAVLTEEGWLRTGDIATIDSKGFLALVDRQKDLIIVSGFNVYPNEVEEVIAEIKGVHEVAVVGMKSDEYGEFAKAFIVRSDPTLMAEEVLNYCHRSLTHYKVPREIEFRNELPKSTVGKILRRALREEV